MQTRKVQLPLGRKRRKANINFRPSKRKWRQCTGLHTHLADSKPQILSSLCINDLSCRHKKNSQGLLTVTESLFHTGSGCILKKFSWINWIVKNKGCGKQRCMCSFWEKLLCRGWSCFPNGFIFVPQRLWEFWLRPLAVWGAWCNALGMARLAPEPVVMAFLLCSLTVRGWFQPAWQTQGETLQRRPCSATTASHLCLGCCPCDGQDHLQQLHPSHSRVFCKDASSTMQSHLSKKKHQPWVREATRVML